MGLNNVKGIDCILKVSVSALSDHLMGRRRRRDKRRQRIVSVSALSDHLMGRNSIAHSGVLTSVSVSALSDHLMGQYVL